MSPLGRHPLFLRLLILQALLLSPVVLGLLLLNQAYWALLLCLAAVAGIIADGLTMLSMRLPGAAGLGLGIVLRWGVLITVLVIAATRLPAWPDMLIFALCLALLRPLATALSTLLASRQADREAAASEARAQN